jgi:poly(hydroxyalkanoate) granule-associated protein
MNMATNLKDVMGGEPAAIADAIAASAHEIWQAGLGAFARAQADGGELFGALVRDGAALHKLTQELAQDKFPDVAGKIGKLAEQVGRQASGSWDKIEKIFEDRVARSLRSLGVPSRDEVDALRREIEALRAAAPARPATARKSAPKAAQPAAKRAAAPRATASKTPAKSKSTRAQAARRNA